MEIEHFLRFLPYLAVFLVGLLIVAIGWVIYRKTRAWPYQAVPVMSAIEKKFFWQLKTAFPDYHILAQVHLSQVIRPPRGKNELKWLNKIWHMSLDYVILDNALEVIAAIELDDRSHLLKRRQEADQRKNKALKAAGVRLIRIQTSHLPDRSQLVNLLEGRH